MTDLGNFPFGQPVQEVVQTDRTPKRVFILGVYASAVHARWLGPDGKTISPALAVASEPSIFWNGSDPDSIIAKISVPPEVGRLVPASKNLNGPSGKTLDEQIIEPIRLKRSDAWLCDLVPYSCRNLGQAKIIKEKYEPLMEKHNLPLATFLPVPKELTDEKRRKVILSEIRESGADTLILLGDKPFESFLSYFDQRWKKLAEFGHEVEQYGQKHLIELNGKQMNLLPLAHPRQIARLGASSPKWFEAHERWIKSAGKVLEQ